MAEESEPQDEPGEEAPAARPVPRVRGSAARAYVAARALRWRVGKAPQGGVPHADAMRFLQNLAQQMPEDQGKAVREFIAQDRVRARRLAPVDGVVWRLPGARLFAIQGMAPFMVPDPPPAQAEGGEADAGEGTGEEAADA